MGLESPISKGIKSNGLKAKIRKGITMEWNAIGYKLAETFKAAETEKAAAAAAEIHKGILEKLVPAKKVTGKATGKLSLQDIFTAIVKENPGISQNAASVKTYETAGLPFTGNHFVNHFRSLINAGLGFFGPVQIDLLNGKAKQGLYLK